MLLPLRSWLAAAQLPLTSAAPPQTPAVSVPTRYTPVSFVQVQHPDWSKSATLHRLDTRQFTTEGTLAAAQKQLPRLEAFTSG